MTLILDVMYDQSDIKHDRINLCQVVLVTSMQPSGFLLCLL